MRIGPTQQRATSLPCFNWSQPTLNPQISYLPLVFASLRIINSLWLDTGSAWAEVRSATAVSFAELQCAGSGSLPYQLAPPPTSLIPHCKLISGMGNRFKSQMWKPVPPQRSLPAWPGGCWESGRRLGRQAATLVGLSRNPNAFRGKVRCFFTPGFSQEWRQWRVGTMSLLDTNKWGQLRQ